MSLKKKINTFLSSDDKINLLYEYFLGNKIIQIKKNRLIQKQKKTKLKFGVKPKIVVSLTSFEPRFEGLPKTLKSLLNQSVKPDKIIVWLDATPEMLTPEMLTLQKYGVTFRCKVENLKPHKKYFFALQEFSDSIVITVDDDIIYPKDLIKSLIKTWKKYPDCICARRVHKMLFNENGSLKPYNDWIFEYKKETKPSHELLACGIGGVLYPPSIFDKNVFDIDKIKKECLEADDIWLKWHELRLGVKVVWAKNKMIHPPVVDGSQNITLSSDNVCNNKNDFFIKNCQENIFNFNKISRGGYNSIVK